MQGEEGETKGFVEACAIKKFQLLVNQMRTLLNDKMFLDLIEVLELTPQPLIRTLKCQHKL